MNSSRQPLPYFVPVINIRVSENTQPSVTFDAILSAMSFLSILLNLEILCTRDINAASEIASSCINYITGMTNTTYAVVLDDPLLRVGVDEPGAVEHRSCEIGQAFQPLTLVRIELRQLPYDVGRDGVPHNVETGEYAQIDHAVYGRA